MSETMRRITAFIFVMFIVGLLVIIGYSVYHDMGTAPVFTTITVADRLSEYNVFGGGNILGTDGYPYTISDFQTTVNEKNIIRETQGLPQIPTQFYWNKMFKINDVYLCEFKIAPAGNYCLSNCTKISGDVP